MKISIDELKKNLSGYINHSQKEDIFITSHGKTIAVITKPEKDAVLMLQNQTPQFETLAEALATIGEVDFDWELLERPTWEPKVLF